MAQLTHSPFLQALGHALINSLWQFALLWLVYVLINAVLKLSSHQKYTAGLLLQLTGFTWFIVTFTLYFRQHQQLAGIFLSLQKTSFFDIAQSDTVSVREKYFAFILQIEKSFPYLSAAYLLILIFSGIKWMKAYNLTNLLKTQGLHKIEVNWRLFVKQLSAQLNIKREVRIYLSELVKSPLTIGFFKPVILIPLASLNNLKTDQMEAVILHELAHIRRFDYFFNFILAIVETVLFFNPFMLLISRHVKRERENCCDDWVLQYNYNAASYAHALLQIATSQSSAFVLALKAADNKQALLHRIRRMIEKKETVFFNYRQQLIALLVMVTVLSSLAILSSHDKITNTALSTFPQEVILQKMMFKSSEPASYRVLHPAPARSNAGEKLPLQKVMNIDLKIDGSRQKEENENHEIERLQTIAGLKHQQVDLTSLVNSNEQSENDFNIDNETQNWQARDFSAEAILQEKQILLAEKNLETAADEFEKDKIQVNQNKFRNQAKLALAQIRAAKAQLESVQREALAQREETNISLQNQLINISLPVLSVKEKLKSLTSKLLLKTKKQGNFSNFNTDCYNFDFNQIGALLNLAPINDVHSFYFGFSETPKVKVVPQSAPNTQTREKRSRVFYEEGRNSKQKNIVEPSPEEPLMPVILGNKVSYTIKI